MSSSLDNTSIDTINYDNQNIEIEFNGNLKRFNFGSREKMLLKVHNKDTKKVYICELEKKELDDCMGTLKVYKDRVSCPYCEFSDRW